MFSIPHYIMYVFPGLIMKARKDAWLLLQMSFQTNEKNIVTGTGIVLVNVKEQRYWGT